MIRKLQHVFALSEKGARDFVKAVMWSFFCNISLMLPVGVVMATLQYLLDTLETGGDPSAKVLVYTGAAAAVLLLLFLLHYFQYASLYLATYQESAARRISLAETLRKLPLSFFSTRDLSDLTATMIADCSALDQMFSHYIPQLFASIFSTIFIGICMLSINLANGPCGAVGVAGGGAADHWLQKAPGCFRYPEHPGQARRDRRHSRGSRDHPRYQVL